MVFNVNRQEGDLYPCDRVRIIWGAHKGRRGVIAGFYEPRYEKGIICATKRQWFWVHTDPIGKKNKRTCQVVFGVDMEKI